MNHDCKAEILVIARVMHEAVRAFQAAHNQEAIPHWNQAPNWMKTASVEGARFRIDNPGASESAQHDQWMQEKLDNGWEYGPIKDQKAKTHPLLIPYEKLPLIERQKDALVAGIISALTKEL